MIQLDKMKNIAYGQSNEGFGSIHSRAIRVDKAARLICSCACADLAIKGGSIRQSIQNLSINCKIHLTKQMIFIWLSVINTNMHIYRSFFTHRSHDRESFVQITTKIFGDEAWHGIMLTAGPREIFACTLKAQQVHKGA